MDKRTRPQVKDLKAYLTGPHALAAAGLPKKTQREPGYPVGGGTGARLRAAHQPPRFTPTAIHNR